MSHPVPGHDYGEPTSGEPYPKKVVKAYNRAKIGPRNTAYDKKKTVAKKMASIKTLKAMIAQPASKAWFAKHGLPKRGK